MLHKVWKKKVEKSRTTLQFDQVILNVVQSTKKFQEQFKQEKIFRTLNN